MDADPIIEYVGVSGFPPLFAVVLKAFFFSALYELEGHIQCGNGHLPMYCFELLFHLFWISSHQCLWLPNSAG